MENNAINIFPYYGIELITLTIMVVPRYQLHHIITIEKIDYLIKTIKLQ
jgi:hypothetical protein